MDRFEIESWLRKYRVESYTINEDMSVDVDGDVHLSSIILSVIPVKFRNVSGNFFCYNNKLTSLEGCPDVVNNAFYCYNNRLTSLLGCPKKVGDFSCGGNLLTSLEGCPIEVSGDFSCNDNRLTSLEGCYVVSGYFNGKDNNLCEEEIFLYDYTTEQISKYYKNKNLHRDLLDGLNQHPDIGIKKKKL